MLLWLPCSPHLLCRSLLNIDLVDQSCYIVSCFLIFIRSLCGISCLVLSSALSSVAESSAAIAVVAAPIEHVMETASIRANIVFLFISYRPLFMYFQNTDMYKKTAAFCGRLLTHDSLAIHIKRSSVLLLRIQIRRPRILDLTIRQFS